MTRDRIKELLPVITAFAEGKTIEVKNKKNEWNEMDDPHFDADPKVYRIKPEPKYRPFESAKECWEEIEKHSHLGWIKFKGVEESYIHCEAIGDSGIFYNSDTWTFEYMFDNFAFIDGSPFGRKED